MINPSVVISLEEYNELANLRNEVYEAFKKQKPIRYYTRVSTGPSGQSWFYVSVINPTDLATELSEQLDEANKQKAELAKENYELKEKLEKKRKWLW